MSLRVISPSALNVSPALFKDLLRNTRTIEISLQIDMCAKHGRRKIITGLN